MKKIVIAAALAILPTCAFSQTSNATKNLATPAPVITVRDCLLILNGLSGLDGYNVLINAGKPNEQVLTRAYEFNNAKLRRDIQTNIAALQVVQQATQKLNQDIFREVAKDSNEIKPDTPQYVEYTKRVSDGEGLPCTAQLVRININDLKLEKNEIPGSVLAALDKILDK